MTRKTNRNKNINIENKTYFCEVCGLDTLFASRYKLRGSICVDCRTMQLLSGLNFVIEECNFLRAKILNIKWQLKQIEVDFKNSLRKE